MGSLFCSIYALKQVKFDNKEMYPITAKTKKNDFHLDEFIKSVKTADEAIEVLVSCNIFFSSVDLN